MSPPPSPVSSPAAPFYPPRPALSQHHPLHKAEDLFAADPPPNATEIEQGLLATHAFVPPTANSQFAAISFLHFGHLRSAHAVRRKIVNWLAQHRTAVTNFIVHQRGSHNGARPYLQQMAKTGTEGDALTLMAAACAYRLALAVANREPDGTLAWAYYPDATQPVYAGLFLDARLYEILYAPDTQPR